MGCCVLGLRILRRLQIEWSSRPLVGATRQGVIRAVNCFSFCVSDTPTCTSLVQHDVDVGEAKPIRQRFYRIPMEKRRRMDSEVQYLLDNGLAVPSDSSCASPCI